MAWASGDDLGDAVALAALGRSSDRIVDGGLYHGIGDEEGRRYVVEVRSTRLRGGLHVMPGLGPSPTA